MKITNKGKLKLNEFPEGFDGDKFIEKNMKRLALAFGLSCKLLTKKGENVQGNNKLKGHRT